MNKKKRNKRFYKLFAVVMALILVCFAAFCIFPLLNGRVNVGESLNDEEIDSFADDGSPVYSVENGEILQGLHISSGDIIVTSNSLVSYKTNGKTRDVTKTGFSNPVVKSSGSKYIVFERSTGKILLMNRSGIISKRDSGNEIINCAVSGNGNYVVITRETQTTSLVSVFSSSGKELFVWECTEAYLTDAAISKNGKYIAVSALEVADGIEKAVVYFFNINSSEIEKVIKFDGSVIYKIGFIGNKTVRVLTNLSFVTMDYPSGEKKEARFDYGGLSACDFYDDGKTAVVRESLGSLSEKTVSVYDDSCKEIYSAQIDGEIFDFYLSSKKLYILSDSQVFIHNIKSGKVSEPLTVNGGITSIYADDGKIFGFSNKNVYIY